MTVKGSTPEQKLLRALFGDDSDHRLAQVKCNKCLKGVKTPIYFNGEPYHKQCLPCTIAD